MKLQFTLHQLVSIRKFYHESSLKGAYSDLFMCYFLLYIEAHHPNSLDSKLCVLCKLRHRFRVTTCLKVGHINIPPMVVQPEKIDFRRFV